MSNPPTAPTHAPVPVSGPKTASPPPYRLRLPGPAPVPDRVKEAMSAPVVNHRGPEFRSTLAQAQEKMQQLLGTREPVLFFASSGTGMMEASLVNTIDAGDRVLVVVNGQFGERFSSIAAALGAQVDTLEVPWGEAVDPDAVRDCVTKIDYRAVVVIHNESSTGIVNPMKDIGDALRDQATLLIADSVSGLGGIEMKQDEWGIDIVVSASQKCLMCPPGTGLVSLSAHARSLVEREGGKHCFYWDFRKALASAAKHETPFTPPTALITGLTESLQMIGEEGIPQVLRRHTRLASALRAGCVALGLSCFGQHDALSSTVVEMNVPDGLNGADIVRLLYERHRMVIAGARNKLAGKIIRLGVMGHIHEDDILRDLAQLEDVLRLLGWSCGTGAGVKAAEAVLASP